MSVNGNGRNRAFLIIQRGSEIGRRVEINKKQITFGRNADNDIVIANPMISRYHAVIQQDLNTGQLSIIDLGSTNGVIVNDNQIDPGLPHPLQQRDSILIGTNVFNLQVRPEGQKPPRPIPREEDPEITQTFILPRLFS